jgi:hypothetical protein
MNRRQFDMSSSALTHPAVIALIIAVFGISAMLVVDYGPWARPHVQTSEVATYKTTGEAARAVGAKVGPTEPKSPLEPAPLAPKPIEPADPVTR